MRWCNRVAFAAILLFNFGFFCAFLTHAADWPPIAPDELALKNNPAEPGAAAMILYREEIINNKDSHDFYSQHYFRIKIFTDAGKQYADIEVPSSKLLGIGEVRDVRGRTIHPDGKVVEFDGKVLDKLIAKAGDVKVEAKAFSLPDVVPGSIIEYSYKISLPAAYLAPGDWDVQTSIYTKRAHFVYQPYGTATTASLLWRTMHLEGTEQPRKQSDGSYILDVHDIPGMPEEDYMLPSAETRARVQFFYTREVGMADPKSYWDHVAKQWAEENEKFIGKRGSIRDLAQQLSAPADSPEAKLRKLYARAQSVHNLDYDPKKTIQEIEREKAKKDASVDDVLKTGSATKLNINQLLVALAQAAGFESSITWVRARTSSFFHPEMQDRSDLNEALVWVHAGDKEYYLDPGNPFCPFGMLPWYESFTTTMRPTKQGAVFTETPLPPSIDSVTYRIAQLTLDPDGSLSGTLTLRLTGQRAFIRRMQGRNQDETGRKKIITDDIKSWLPGSAKFDLTAVTGWDNNDAPIEAQGTVSMPAIATVAGRRVLLPLDLFAAGKKQTFESSKRKQDIYFSFPSTGVDEFTIQLPTNLKASSLTKPQVFNLGAEFHYESTVSQAGDTLHIQRKQLVNGVLYPVDSYGDIRSFYSLVKANDEQQIVLQAPASGN